MSNIKNDLLYIIVMVKRMRSMISYMHRIFLVIVIYVKSWYLYLTVGRPDGNVFWVTIIIKLPWWKMRYCTVWTIIMYYLSHQERRFPVVHMRRAIAHWKCIFLRPVPVHSFNHLLLFIHVFIQQSKINFLLIFFLHLINQ